MNMPFRQPLLSTILWTITVFYPGLSEAVPPLAVEGTLEATQSITLEWDPVSIDTSGNPEAGTVYYTVYHDSVPTFTPSEQTVLTATTDTSFQYLADAGQPHYYRVVAQDEWGNTSTTSPLVGSSPFVLLSLRVYLQGPFDAEGDTMHTALNAGGYIPTRSPYSEAPREVASIPETVVDWVLVELRQTDTGTPVCQESFFIDQSGQIVELDGDTAQLAMTGTENGDYYVLVRHRNHIGVMSAQTTALDSASTSTIDLTQTETSVYGSDLASLSGDVYGLYSGDANHNEQVQNDDKNDHWQSQVGGAGYLDADFNLNGQVQNDDKNDFWQYNAGKGTQVP
jgi:hypothetical protein